MVPNAAICVFVVLATAKLLVVGPVSPSLFVQDALVAAAFVPVELALRRHRNWIWLPYSLAVVWIAINVPVALVLRTWVTMPMVRAAGGPLADSIRYYLTPSNLVPLAIVLAAGAALPILIARRKSAFIVASSCLIVFAAATTTPKSSNGFARTPLAILKKTTSGVVSAETTPDVAFSPMHGAAKGMNVLVVVLESTAAQYLGMYGAREDPMPNLSALARRSVVFDAAYAVYPESVKGLYAALCGRAPRVGEPLEASLDDPCSPLPKQLSSAGYRTGLFHSGRFSYLGMDALVRQSGFDVAEDAGVISGVVRSSFGVDEASTIDRVMRWISDESDARPFFAMYLPAAGHHPYATAVPGPFDTSTEFNRYRNALHEADVALGALLAAAPENTVVMVYGDHGEAFGQHGGNTGHTLAIWDENIRVPMLIAVPGATDGGRRVTATVSTLDIAPTVIDLLAADDAPAANSGAPFIGHSMFAEGERAVPFFADYSRELFGMRDGCWKIQYDRTDNQTSLFNLCDDPNETSDLAGRFELVHDKLVERMEQLFAIRVRPRRVAS